MTTSNAMTAGDFFRPNSKNLPLQIALGFDSSADLKSLKSLFSKKLGPMEFATVLTSAAEKMRELLDIRLSDIMARAWNRSREVRGALDRTKKSEGETVLLPLVEHVIESEHHPYLEVKQGQKTLGRVVFRIDLSLHVEGVQIKIQQGMIREIIAGEVQAQGTVKLGDCKILEKEFEPIPIRGSIAFEGEDAEPAGSERGKAVGIDHPGAAPTFAVLS